MYEYDDSEYAKYSPEHSRHYGIAGKLHDICHECQILMGVSKLDTIVSDLHVAQAIAVWNAAEAIFKSHYGSIEAATAATNAMIGHGLDKNMADHIISLFPSLDI